MLPMCLTWGIITPFLIERECWGVLKMVSGKWWRWDLNSEFDSTTLCCLKIMSSCEARIVMPLGNHYPFHIRTHAFTLLLHLSCPPTSIYLFILSEGGREKNPRGTRLPGKDEMTFSVDTLWLCSWMANPLFLSPFPNLVSGLNEPLSCKWHAQYRLD